MPSLSSRLTPEEHALIQQSLVVLGLLEDKPDGEFGSNTRSAIRLFKEQIGDTAGGDFLTTDQREQLLQQKSPPPRAPTGPPPISLPAPVALDFPHLTGRVVDQAGIISADARSDIGAKSKELEDKSGVQLVVATVKSLQGTDIETYAYQLFNVWKLGQAKKNNGVLLLVAPAEHKVRIEVGYGLEATLTDFLCSDIITSAIIPRFKTGDFSGGIEGGVDGIISASSNLAVPGSGPSSPSVARKTVPAPTPERREDEKMRSYEELILVAMSSAIILLGAAVGYLFFRLRNSQVKAVPMAAAATETLGETPLGTATVQLSATEAALATRAPLAELELPRFEASEVSVEEATQSQANADESVPNFTPAPVHGSNIPRHAEGYAGHDTKSGPGLRSFNWTTRSWGRIAFAVVIFGMALGGLVFVVGSSIGGGDGASAPGSLPTAAVTAKRDIKGFRPGMTLTEVQARIPNWAYCRPNNDEAAQMYSLLCPVTPPDLDFNAPDDGRPRTLLMFQVTHYSKPEWVLVVSYFYSSKNTAAIMIGQPNIPGIENPLAELDREIAIIQKEFSVGAPEKCATNPGAKPMPFCIQWPLEGGAYLKFALTWGNMFMVSLTAPTSLVQQEKEAFQKSLPNKF